MPPAPSATRLHLVYGNDEVKVNDARTALVARYLQPDDRAGNLTEIRPAGTQPLRLEKALSEITAELGTISLLPEVPRVVVIYNLADLFGASKKSTAAPKKKASGDPVEALESFLLGPFQEGLNAAVFVCEEDEDKNKAVDENTALFRLLSRVGDRQVFREKPISRDLEAALYAGNWVLSIEVMRRWRERAGSEASARLKLYRTVAQWAEMILQAKCLQTASEGGARPPSDLIPANAWPSIARLPEGLRRGANQLARALSFSQLRSLVESLHRVQRLMYPTGEENFVADWYGALEQAVMESGAATMAER